MAQLKNHSRNGSCPRVTCIECGVITSVQLFPRHQAVCVPMEQTPVVETEGSGAMAKEVSPDVPGGLDEGSEEGGVVMCEQRGDGNLEDFRGLTLEEALAAGLEIDEYEIVTK